MITGIEAQIPVRVPGKDRPVTGKLTIDEFGGVQITIDTPGVAETLLGMFSVYESTHLLDAGIFLREARPASVPGLEDQ